MDPSRPFLGRGRGLAGFTPVAAPAAEAPRAPPPQAQGVQPCTSTGSMLPPAPTQNAPLILGRGRGIFSEAMKQIKASAINAPASDNLSSQPSPPSSLSSVFVPGKGRGLKVFPSQPSTPSPQPSEVASITQPMSQVSLHTSVTKPFSEVKDTPPVVRMGTVGEKFEAAVNYICLKIKQGMGVFEYEVRFNPSVDAKGIKINLVKQLEEALGRTRTFDGTVLYLPFQLDEAVTTFEAIHPASQEKIEIKVIFKRLRKMGEVIHLYNVLFKRIMGELQLVRFNRSFFDPSSPHLIPQHKLEVWPGYVTAVDEYEGGLFLSIDSSHRVLRTETVLEHIRTIIQTDPNNYRSAVTKSLTGSSVITRYNNNVYRIDEVLFNGTPLDTFEMSTGESISYVDYYKNQYRIDILEINQPLLINRKSHKISGKEEEVERLIVLVPELCYMTGLSDSQRNNFSLMKDVATYTRITPAQRVYALEKFVQNVRKCEPARKMLSDWGLELADKAHVMGGRRLQPESIAFGGADGGRVKTVSAGPRADWNREATANPVGDPVHIESWVLLHGSRDTSRANEFVDIICRCGPPMGISISKPQRIKVDSDRNPSWAEAVRTALRNGPQLITCIAPNARDDRYAMIKRICCVDTPTPSQIINSHTLGNPNKIRSIVQKIALQINCKLGGILWKVPLPFRNLIMVCGIDSYHDAGNRDRSVVAFVSSYDNTLTRWHSRAEFQNKGQEIVDCLKMCFGDALAHFVNVNRELPARVIIYRDGVGDGQLELCCKYEAPQMLEVLRNNDKQIHFTYIVVQKRINTRIFLRGAGRENFNNPAPGSIVDNTITRRNWYDFFMVSQHVSQGTVTPSHYIVVHDTSNSKPDNVQRLTYILCHLYYNWPGTIRVPAPCQYAHKLAYLLGVHVHQTHHSSLNDKLFFL